MSDEIFGVMAVKNGQKQTIMNLSNARQKSYADLQNMTDAQKKGVIVCSDYPKGAYLVQADQVGYGSGTVKDALDERKPILKRTLTGTTNPNGLLALNDLSVIVLTARETTSGNNHRIVLVGGYNAGRQNIFKVCNTSDMSPLANTFVTIDYWYINS